MSAIREGGGWVVAKGGDLVVVLGGSDRVERPRFTTSRFNLAARLESGLVTGYQRGLGGQPSAAYRCVSARLWMNTRKHAGSSPPLQNSTTPIKRDAHARIYAVPRTLLSSLAHAKQPPVHLLTRESGG